MKKHSNKNRIGLLFLMGITLLSFVSASAQVIVFSGDAEKDFSDPQVTIITDGTQPDVGIPGNFPAGVISGNDIKDLRLIYDAANDVLYVGLNTWGIAGDVDGDGEPSVSREMLVQNGGTDRPDFSGTESVTVYFDLDSDGTYDIIAGVPAQADYTEFSLNRYDGKPTNPAKAFGASLSAQLGDVSENPSTASPDVEFSIRNFSSLSANARSFSVNAKIGSAEDDGIGEDYLAAQAVAVKLQ